MILLKTLIILSVTVIIIIALIFMKKKLKKKESYATFIVCSAGVWHFIINITANFNPGQNNTAKNLIYTTFSNDGEIWILILIWLLVYTYHIFRK